MNNFLMSVKRFFKNKNTVTIICIILILGLLYFVYTSQINAAVKPVTIPVAKVDIQPRTEITSEMITTIEVPANAVSEDTIRNALNNNIVGKYTNINCYIPAGSMFYNSQLVDKSALPDSAFTQVKEGEIPYQFAVDMKTTYGNSIFPGNKIDIYMKATDEDGKIMIGRLLQNVEVLAVKDSQGNNVFDQTDTNPTPSYLLFGVPESIHIMLRKCEYLQSQGIELFPVPHGGNVTTEGELTVDIQTLVDYINSLTVDLLIDTETE